MTPDIGRDDEEYRVARALGSLGRRINANGNPPRVGWLIIEVPDVLGTQQLADRSRRVLLILCSEDHRAARPDLVDLWWWIEPGQQRLANFPTPQPNPNRVCHLLLGDQRQTNVTPNPLGQEMPCQIVFMQPLMDNNDRAARR